MEWEALAAQLAAADDAERLALVERHAPAAGGALAQALRGVYLQDSNANPLRAGGAAAALSLLARASADEEVQALAAWVEGLAALQLHGQMDMGLARLDDAAARFQALSQDVLAASTQVGKV